MDENNVKARSKKKKTLVIVVVLVLFATVGALGAVCIHLYQKSNAGQEEETTLKNAAVSGSSIVVSDDKRDVAGEIKQKAAAGYSKTDVRQAMLILPIQREIPMT